MGNDRAGRAQENGQSLQAGGKTQASMAKWGRELRRLREASKWSQAELAQRMYCDDSVISRLETGVLAPTPKTAGAADEAFGLPGSMMSLRETLISLGVVRWQPDIAEMEQRAKSLSLWDPCFIPGLLQTEAYMRAVFLTGQPDATDEQIQMCIEERLARQELWLRADPPPPVLHAMIWEPAILVPVGGESTMREQLKKLAEDLRTNRRVRLQVLPIKHGSIAGMNGAFTVVHFADDDPAALLDSILSGQMTQNRAEVARLSMLFSTMAADAMTPQASLELIEKVAGE